MVQAGPTRNIGSPNTPNRRAERDERRQIGSLAEFITTNDENEPRSPSLLAAPTAGAASAINGQDDEGVGVLHERIDALRRENRELKRKLYALDGDSNVGLDHMADNGKRGPPDAFDSLRLSVESLAARTPSSGAARFARVEERLREAGVWWSERGRRVQALHAALLGSEATCATLHEELLTVEASAATLGASLKGVCAELEATRHAADAAEARAHKAAHDAAYYRVSRDEEAKLHALRREADEPTRRALAGLQAKLDDAHATLE